MTPRTVVKGKIISLLRCSRQAFRNTSSIQIDARPTKDMCTILSQPRGADGTQTGQPTHNAHAEVSVTKQPATVRARTAKNKPSTYREKDERSEYFMPVEIPVSEQKMDNRLIRWMQK